MPASLGEDVELTYAAEIHLHVSQMGELLYDTRFEYQYDTPFEKDVTKEQLNRLKAYIKQHPDDYTEVDYLNDSRFVIMSGTTTLFNTRIVSPDISAHPLLALVKRFLIASPIASKELKEWCHEEVPIVAETEADVEANDNVEDETPVDIPTIPMPSISMRPTPTSIVTYDVSNERTLTYEELKRLSINIARHRADPAQRDASVVAMEQEKRRALIQEIRGFKNVTCINPYIEGDLTTMTLDQLEECRDKCERYHSQFKVDAVLKSGFNVCTTGYSVLFPDGIPIGNDRRIQFNGISKVIRNNLFDSRKTVGFSFSRILAKHNINITDEYAVLMSIGETLLTHSKIVKVNTDKDKGKKKSKHVQPSVDVEPDDSSDGDDMLLE